MAPYRALKRNTDLAGGRIWAAIAIAGVIWSVISAAFAGNSDEGRGLVPKTATEWTIVITITSNNPVEPLDRVTVCHDGGLKIERTTKRNGKVEFLHQETLNGEQTKLVFAAAANTINGFELDRRLYKQVYDAIKVEVSVSTSRRGVTVKFDDLFKIKDAGHELDTIIEMFNARLKTQRKIG
ncbi:MAG TPA: hypothetical protein VKU82_06955 [Planctomycetaceae bacterium]|nr:hypothetical protein [Planctomycetaceae bacterium]